MKELRYQIVTAALLILVAVLPYPQVTTAQSDECLQQCEAACLVRKNNEQIMGNAFGLHRNCEESCVEACAEFRDDTPELSAQLKSALGLPADFIGRTTGEGSRVCGPGACICTGPGDCINLILACQETDKYRVQWC